MVLILRRRPNSRSTPWQHANVANWFAIVIVFVCSFINNGTAQATADTQVNNSTQLLVDMTNYVRNEDLDVRALVVMQHGQTRLEWHSGLSSPAHSHRIYSCTKSVTSALLGIALARQSRLGLESRLHEVFPQQLSANSGADTIGEVSIAQLLQMRSGLPSTRAPSRRFWQLHNAKDRLTWALALRPVDRPSQRFRYGNVEPQILLSVVQQLRAEGTRKFARQALFEPLGFRNQQWQFADAVGMVTGGYGLRLRAIDMARFGELFLRGGQWHGKQVISAAWVAQSTTTHSTERYGYMWWNHVPASGYRSFAALGLYGQVIQVVPELGLVFVMTANLSRSQSKIVRRKLVERYVIPAALAARNASSPVDAAALLSARDAGKRFVPSSRTAGGKRNLPKL